MAGVEEIEADRLTVGLRVCVALDSEMQMKAMMKQNQRGTPIDELSLCHYKQVHRSACS